jgi:hypothetical protein
MSVIDRVSLGAQIAEVHREIEQRKRVYVRMIDQGKMTSTEAERRLTAMAAVLMTLEQLRETRRGDVAAAPTVHQS